MPSRGHLPDTCGRLPFAQREPVKLDTLRGVLERQRCVKLFVFAEHFCLSGYVRNPRTTEAGLLIDIGPSIRFVFASGELLHEPVRSGSLELTPSCKITRRVHTHQRHLESKGVPDGYLKQALGL